MNCAAVQIRKKEHSLHGHYANFYPQYGVYLTMVFTLKAITSCRMTAMPPQVVKWMMIIRLREYRHCIARIGEIQNCMKSPHRLCFWQHIIAALQNWRIFISTFSSKHDLNTSQFKLIWSMKMVCLHFSLGFSAELPTNEEQSLVMNHRIQVDSLWILLKYTCILLMIFSI